MAYYLTIKRKNDYYKIDLSSLSDFKRLSRFKNDSYSLEELDNFTSTFDSEVNLKKYLYENNLISFDEITKELSIRMKYKDKLDKVKYGLVYKNMKKFLDIDYLRYTILSLQNDFEFLKILVDNYRNSYSNNLNICKIRGYLINKNSDINIYNSLSDFYLKEVFKENTYELVIKYKSFHDLAMFVYNYISNKEKNRLGINKNLEKVVREKNLLELQKSIITTLEVKKKTKKKEKQQVEGQLSFEDVML